jgi:hypothetical protein
VDRTKWIQTGESQIYLVILILIVKINVEKINNNGAVKVLGNIKKNFANLNENSNELHVLIHQMIIFQ